VIAVSTLLMFDYDSDYDNDNEGTRSRNLCSDALVGGLSNVLTLEASKRRLAWCLGLGNSEHIGVQVDTQAPLLCIHLMPLGPSGLIGLQIGYRAFDTGTVNGLTLRAFISNQDQ